jgi:hypothetical protein
MLAVIASGSRFGTYSPRQRVLFVDSAGRTRAPAVVFGQSEWIGELQWVGDRLVALVYVPEAEWSRVYVLRPGDEATPSPLIELKERVLGLGESPSPDRMVLVRTLDGKLIYGSESQDVELYMLDLDSGRLAPKPFLRETASSRMRWWYRSGASPSGRYRVVRRPGPRMWIPDLAVLDHETGEERPFGVRGRTRQWAWWGDDHLVRLDGSETKRDRIVVVSPAGDERAVAELRNGGFYPSPDGRRLLVFGRRITPADGAPLASGLAVYEPRTGAWTELPTEGLADEPWIEWAGPDVLSVTTPDGLALMDLDGTLRPVERG